ncbi:MAG: hypothetical protein ACRDNL_08345 [Spirillospora sp.]
MAAPTIETPPEAARPARRPPWALVVPAAIFATALVAAVVAVVVFVRSDDGGSGDPPPSVNASVPSGFRLYRGSAFVAAVPRGWTAEGSGDDVTFKDPAQGVTRGMVIQRVTNTDTADPGDALADALFRMKNDTAEYPEFSQESLNRNLAYLGRTAAEAQFTFTKDGLPGRVRVRVFKLDDAIYQVILVAAQKGWDGAVPVYETFLKTLRSTS